MPNQPPSASNLTLPRYPLFGVNLDRQDIPRPIVISRHAMNRGEATGIHTHQREQIVYAHSGLVLVNTQHGTWVVPPSRAVWVPSKLEHGVQAMKDSIMSNLFLAPGTVPNLPKTCAVLAVPTVLRELIDYATRIEFLYDETGSDGRVMRVILDMLNTLHEVPLHLPMPKDTRLRRVAEALVENPSDPRTQAQWAKSCGASVRTLARLFPEQTGMTFNQWRQQARLMAALGRLADGEAVISVALDLGYASQSAFIAMFKKALGTTPGKYFSPQLT
ncbi:AraC family transcriptional regulator [Magnetovibrio blakemorei]|uniref:HTH araC/xylS-type domain-containing protein n=1 Tax=Magnetovibrio blakemorei TaxID=28181 RepID=A0A1E5QA73_9PROT|nr:helix-turn-helix transcriptional regulator [Magnetovibrio blakemorei]OEJ68544.1 hypothetical protein BEN30_06010 [Magnetovibrio blakemorei]